MFLRGGEEDGGKMMATGAAMRGNKVRVRVRPEEVVEAANLAVSGQPFEVVYYPRASTPEFCVKAGAVRAAMHTQWCAGMRFKMAFETEDSSRISWFMGTVSAVQVADPIRWPNSPWRLLQVKKTNLHNCQCVLSSQGRHLKVPSSLSSLQSSLGGAYKLQSSLREKCMLINFFDRSLGMNRTCYRT
jgi:hypothetical protein